MKTPPPRSCRRAFTLAEVFVAMAISSVVCLTTLSGVIFLQKSYAATEQYATSMADQQRVLDYLAMDLRRASSVTVDNLNKSLTITLPAYYTYDPSDTKHQSPMPVLPTVVSNSQRAVYSAGTGAATPGVWYRFDPPSNQLQRREYYTDGADSGWQTVASQVSGFPVITPDPTIPQKYTISLSFTPTFQTLDTPVSSVITLTSTVFLRNS